VKFGNNNYFLSDWKLKQIKLLSRRPVVTIPSFLLSFSLFLPRNTQWNGGKTPFEAPHCLLQVIVSSHHHPPMNFY
jgi:hypothetical protein